MGGAGGVGDVRQGVVHIGRSQRQSRMHVVSGHDNTSHMSSGDVDIKERERERGVLVWVGGKESRMQCKIEVAIRVVT